jgi:hypothetical protein
MIPRLNPPDESPAEPAAAPRRLGAIAHDLNNALGAIGNALQLVRIRVQRGNIGDIERLLQLAEANVDKGAGLTAELHAQDASRIGGLSGRSSPGSGS